MRGWGSAAKRVICRSPTRRDFPRRLNFGRPSPSRCCCSSWARICLARWLTSLGHAGETGDVDAVAFVGGAVDDLVEEDDLVFPFADGDVEVFHAR